MLETLVLYFGPLAKCLPPLFWKYRISFVVEIFYSSQRDARSLSPSYYLCHIAVHELKLSGCLSLHYVEFDNKMNISPDIKDKSFPFHPCIPVGILGHLLFNVSLLHRQI